MGELDERIKESRDLLGAERQSKGFVHIVYRFFSRLWHMGDVFRTGPVPD